MGMPNGSPGVTFVIDRGRCACSKGVPKAAVGMDMIGMDIDPDLVAFSLRVMAEDPLVSDGPCRTFAMCSRRLVASAIWCWVARRPGAGCCRSEAVRSKSVRSDPETAMNLTFEAEYTSNAPSSAGNNLGMRCKTIRALNVII